MMFWYLLPRPVIGRQAYRLLPMSTAEWEENKILFDEKTGITWPDAEKVKEPNSQGNMSCDNPGSLSWKTDSTWKNTIQTTAEFSNAIAVMGKIGGWEVKDWVESRFAASVWIYTKTVIRNGQDHKDTG